MEVGKKMAQTSSSFKFKKETRIVSKTSVSKSTQKKATTVSKKKTSKPTSKSKDADETWRTVKFANLDDQRVSQSDRTSPDRRRWSDVNLHSDREVMEILNNIQSEKKKREQNEVFIKLKGIKNRVRQCLENVGLPPDDIDAGQLILPPLYDAKSERERMIGRTSLIDKIEDFTVKSIDRKLYLNEVNLWFQENINICQDFMTDDEFKFYVSETMAIHRTLIETLDAFCVTGQKIVFHGNALLEEADKMYKEKMAQLSKKTRKEKMIIFDDKVLVNDPIKWDSACKNVISVFEDSQKMMRNIMFKNALRQGQTQYQYQMMAVEKRTKEMDEKRRLCMELQGKLHTAKIQGDKLSKEIEEHKRKHGKTTLELSETKSIVASLQERSKTLNNTIMELQAKIKFLQEELNRPKTPPPPPATPPPPPEPEKVIIKVVDSATELRLYEVEEELRGAKEKISVSLARIADLEKWLSQERGKNKNLEAKVIELESMPEPEPQPVIDLANMKMPPVQDTGPGQSLQEKDINYFKTLMNGLKNEFSQEMEKMKNYVKRERHRSEAGLRRLEMQQKDHLSAIQKDLIRMLRAIMHFRDAMVVILEKELLYEPAQALQRLGSLTEEKLSPDPKEVLAVVLVTVVEYLSNMENVMSNAFLALKTLIKYQIEKQMEKQLEAEVAFRQQKEKSEKEAKKIVKDIGDRKKQLQSATNDVKGMAKRLKKTKNRLKKYRTSLVDTDFTGDKKYDNLMKRYKHVWKLYQKMQKEMDNLQQDFNETIKKKLEEQETMMVTQLKTAEKQHRDMAAEQLRVAIQDQKANLRLLTKAYEDKKLSKHLHSMATALIQRTMEIPKLKLQTLMEQYITYRAVKDAQARVQRVLQDEDMAVDVRRDMECYSDHMDNKLKVSMLHCSEQMKHLESEKQTINQQMFRLFNEILLESGVLLIHPLLKEKKSDHMLKTVASSIDKEKMQKLLLRRPNNVKNILKLPDTLEGASVSLKTREEKEEQSQILSGLGSNAKYWIPLQQNKETGNLPVIVAPHMQGYEINRTRRNSLKNIMLMGSSWRKMHWNIPTIRGFSIKSGSSSRISVF